MRSLVAEGYVPRNRQRELERQVADAEAALAKYRTDVARLKPLAEIQAGGIPWFWANGKQRVFVQDFDHGTRREWRSPKHSIN